MLWYTHSEFEPSTMLLQAILFALFVAGFTGISVMYGVGAEEWTPPSPLPTLEHNDLMLKYGERIFEGEALGPESITADSRTGWIYTGLMNGQIIRFKDPSHKEIFTWLNPTCVNSQAHKAKTYAEYDHMMEPICGRPLGMRVDEDNNALLVIDAYSGLRSIDLDTREIRALSTGSKFANDFDFDGDDIYFTESSPRWGRNRVVIEVVAAKHHASMLHLDRKTGEKTVLVTNMTMTNGLTLSHDRERVYFVSGPAIHSWNRKTTQFEGKAIDNLPCVPDNIRRHPDGKTYLLACGGRRTKPFALLDFLAPYPTLREVLLFVLGQNQHYIIPLMPVHSMVLRLDLEKGEIISSVQDPTGSMGFCSEAEKVGDYLYIGSWLQNFIVRMPWDKTGF